MKNCYNTLGIQSTATAQEITAAYQQLASKTTAANLIEVKKAYEVLKDNASKNHYDTYLTDEYHLHNAVYFGDGKGVARYIAWGTDINKVNNTGNTVLHLAARCQNGPFITGLIKNGADPTIENKAHQTALAIAVEKDHDTKMKTMDFRYTQTVDAIISSAKACGILENVIEAYISEESNRDIATALNPNNPVLVDQILKQEGFKKLTSLRNTMTDQEILVPIIQSIEARKNIVEPAAKRIKLEQNVAEAKSESSQNSTEGTFSTRIKREKEAQSKKDPFIG